MSDDERAKKLIAYLETISKIWQEVGTVEISQNFFDWIIDEVKAISSPRA